MQKIGQLYHAAAVDCATVTKFGAKAMARRAVKRRAWNKGLQVGQKEALAAAQVKQIRRVLADQGVAGLRDSALFGVAIDTMLPGPQLVGLTALWGQVKRICASTFALICDFPHGEHVAFGDELQIA
jgi:hypothetical protein